MSVDFFGEVTGNICVTAKIDFTDGTSQEITRMWRIEGPVIPEINFLLSSSPSDPSIGWFPASDTCDLMR